MYRAFHGGRCYQLGVNVATANAQTFDPPAKEFANEDRRAVRSRLDAARASFRFLKSFLQPSRKNRAQGRGFSFSPNAEALGGMLVNGASCLSFLQFSWPRASLPRFFWLLSWALFSPPFWGPFLLV